MSLAIETKGVNIDEDDKIEHIATRKDTCESMSDLFDYTNCNQKIWMDIFCKTGNTIDALKEKGVNKTNIAAICACKQSQLIACIKLYGELLPEEMVANTLGLSKSYKIVRRGQIYYIDGWQNIVKDICKSGSINETVAYRIINEIILKEMEIGMKNATLDFTSEDREFGIDNIIMNPPYNPNDLYIDFVTLAKSIALESTVAVTPGKFQSKGGEKNEAFRNNIVPYISNIVYYHDSTDVFDIALSGGIAIYTVTNQIHMDKIVNGKTIKDFDIDVPFDITDTELSILGKIKSEPKIVNRGNFKECKGYFISILPTVIEQGTGTNYVDMTSNIYLTDCTGRKIPIDKSKVRNIADAYKYKLGISLHTFENGAYTSHIWEPNYIVGRNELILFVGTKEECEYADSFFRSKLIYWLSKRFFGSQTASALSFKFIPDPGTFDHIFTDDELYKKYGLTEEEISIIESVIKERK